MDFIRFCRGGVLRCTFSTYNGETGEHISRHVPFQVWEDAVDPNAFLKTLHNYVFFEDGLTVGELMENLAPWAGTMAGAASMDFSAFLAEVRHEPTALQEEVSHIALRYRICIRPVPAFKKQDEPLSKTKDERYVFAPGQPIRTGRLTIDEGWDSYAVLKPEHRHHYDGSESISLNVSPMNEWKHLPILIDEAGVLYDETALASSAAYLGTRKALTRKDHPNVAAKTLPNGRRGMHEISIDAPCPTFFDVIIRGFLWEVGFHYSPVKRTRFRKELLEQVARLDAEGAGIEEEKKELSRMNQVRFEAGLAMIKRLEASASRLGLPLMEN